MRAYLPIGIVLIAACACAEENKMTVVMSRLAVAKEGYGRYLAFSTNDRWAAAEDGHFAVWSGGALERRGEAGARTTGGVRFVGQTLVVSPFTYDLAAGRWADSGAWPAALVAGLPPGAPAGNFEVQAAAASPDGNEVVVGAAYRPDPRIGAGRYGGIESRLLVLKARSFELVAALADQKSHQEWTAAAISDLFIAAAAMNALAVFDRRTHQRTAQLRKHSGAIRGLAFSADGKWLASVSKGADDLVVLWDTATWHEVKSWSGHHGGVRAVAFHPTRPLLATGGDDGQLRIWSLPDGALVHAEPCGDVEGLAFSADGHRLAAAVQSPNRELLLFEMK